VRVHGDASAWYKAGYFTFHWPINKWGLSPFSRGKHKWGLSPFIWRVFEITNLIIRKAVHHGFGNVSLPGTEI
jgi:hypothetical protein